MAAFHRILLAGLLFFVSAPPAFAQQRVTEGDVERLQDYLSQAQEDITRLRSTDAARAKQLQAELDSLRDEVAYLRVKLRKERSLARSEYADVRDRIQDLRTRADETAATNRAAAPAAAPAARAGDTIEIPVGTEMDVRLSTALNSGTAKVEDRFEATTLEDLHVDGRAVVPAGSVLRGVVSAVEPGTRTNRTARMTVNFDQITVNGRPYPMRGTVTEAIEGEGIRGEAGRAGVGAGIGGILGGLLGGFKGALAGILIGGGGTIAATEGKEVDMPQGSVLRVRLDSPLRLQNTARR